MQAHSEVWANTGVCWRTQSLAIALRVLPAKPKVCRRPHNFVGALGVRCQRPRCFACEDWSVAGELNIIRASCELGVLWACSGFCWRSQGIAGELRVLRADFDFCVRASYFAVELNAASGIAALGTVMGSAADALARVWPEELRASHDAVGGHHWKDAFSFTAQQQCQWYAQTHEKGARPSTLQAIHHSQLALRRMGYQKAHFFRFLPP